ncbi:unnamed protein product [Toxocara canis]|uniref:RWD domain-containing protein n=1 Tax=Toxocara canis TaxID=6265 RepID=A0A183V3K2_TOXCA|nr:unnamed protein product [Toxocara canis]
MLRIGASVQRPPDNSRKTILSYVANVQWCDELEHRFHSLIDKVGRGQHPGCEVFIRGWSGDVGAGIVSHSFPNYGQLGFLSGRSAKVQLFKRLYLSIEALAAPKLLGSFI